MVILASLDVPLWEAPVPLRVLQQKYASMIDEYETAGSLHMVRLMGDGKNPWEAEAIHQGGFRNGYGGCRRVGNNKDSDGQ